MNLEKVVFGFFVILACTLSFGFFIGEIDNVKLHDAGHLFAAVVINLIALVMKFGDRNCHDLQRRFLLEPNPLTYVRTGIEPPRSWLFRRLLLRDRT